VIMTWEGQRLPFDVSNQRAIMTRRDFMEIDPARQKLIRAFSGLTESAGFSPGRICDSTFVLIRHGDCDGQAIFSGLA
jgi:hypothetical protein